MGIFNPLVIGDLKAERPVIQGGMGVGISLSSLAGAVAKAGGIGIISTAQIGFRDPDFLKAPLEANLRAIKTELDKARALAPKGILGFNIMVATKNYALYVKEAVKAGVTTYVDDIQAFIPASQISTQYVEKLEDWVGKYLEVVPITVDSEKKRLVLSGRVVQKEKEAAEKAAKLASVKAGSVLEGEVESLKDYGAFIKLDAGVTGLLHVSQISRQRIKHPGVVLKEGQRVTVKVLGVNENKISLSMRALEAEDEPREEVVFDYKESGQATTGLGALLKGIKL